MSPSVATMTASASSMPASRSTSESMPCPTTKPPVQFSPSRWSASSFSSTAQTSQPSACNAFALAEPTRPQPMTTAFTAAGWPSILLEHVLREATTSTSHGALRRTCSTVGEKKRDCRRQRGAEPSTMRSTSCSVACRTISPIERARTVLPRTTTPWSSPSRRASSSDSTARSSSAGSAGASRLFGQRHAHDVERLDVGAALLGELHGRRDHLLADQAELHRHEDLRQRGLRGAPPARRARSHAQTASPRWRRTRP